MSSYYLQYLPVLAAAALCLVVGAVCFAGSQRAFERSRKNLSWIKRHGAGGYPFARNAFPKRAADWLGVFAVAVFALVVSMVVSALRSYFAGVNWLSGLFSAASLGAIGIAVCAAIAVYFLLQLLFGSTLVSASGALLFAADYVGAHTAAALLAIAVLLLVLWLTAKQERLLPAELLYWAAALCYCAALSLRPQLLPFCLLFVGLHLYKHIFYLRRDEERPGIFALALVLALIVWVLGLALYLAGQVFVFFRLTPEFVRSHFAGHPIFAVRLFLRSGLYLVTKPLLRSRVLLPIMDAPLLGLGGFGAISALVLYLRRKDPRSILVLLVLFFAVVVWLLSDTSVLSLGLTLTAALLFSNYERGGKSYPVAIVATLGVIYYLALCLGARFIPMVAGILERLP